MSRRQIILQLKTPRRRLRIRLLLPVSAALLLLPIVLLHVLSFVVSLHDRRMRQYMPALVTDSFGHRLRYYELKKPNAAWNIIFIHGTPGTAAIFGEQFRHPF